MTEDPPPHPKQGRAGKHLAVLVAVVALGLLNMMVPVLRFESQAANLAAGCVLLLLPALAPFLILRLEVGRMARILVTLGVSPLVALSLLLALLTGSCLKDTRATGFDPSFEPLAVLPLAGSRCAAYRTNGGAMTSFGILVRHEMNLLPGLLLVRNLFGVYRASEASLRLVSPEQVEVRVNGHNTIVPIRRFVYF